MTAVSAEDETQAQVTLSIDLGKPSLKKKKECNIFYTRVWPPPLYSGKCNENPKTKNKAFKMQY